MAEDLITRRCSTCHEVKALEEFYRNRAYRLGRTNECKLCVKARVLDYLKTPRGKATQSLRSARYYRTEKRQESLKNYYTTPEYKDSSKRRAKKVWSDPEHRPKLLARSAVSKALIAGKIQRPELCERCGKRAKRIEAHHHLGYEREHWLHVVWLCSVCHPRR